MAAKFAKKDKDVNAWRMGGVLSNGFPCNKKQPDMLAEANTGVDMFVLLQVDHNKFVRHTVGRAARAKYSSA